RDRASVGKQRGPNRCRKQAGTAAGRGRDTRGQEHRPQGCFCVSDPEPAIVAGGDVCEHVGAVWCVYAGGACWWGSSWGRGTPGSGMRGGRERRSGDVFSQHGWRQAGAASARGVLGARAVFRAAPVRGLQGHRSCLPARRSVGQDRPCCVRPCSRDARSRGSRPVWSGLAPGAGLGKAAQGGAGRGVGGCRSCEALRRGAG
ncbi:unnamed protein product, partial [Scytosiphon promiscuus]